MLSFVFLGSWQMIGISFIELLFVMFKYDPKADNRNNEAILQSDNLFPLIDIQSFLKGSLIINPIPS